MDLGDARVVGSLGWIGADGSDGFVAYYEVRSDGRKEQGEGS